MSAVNNKPSVYENTNGMPLANGKNLHMDVGRGELADRIITVGTNNDTSMIQCCFYAF